MTFIVEQHKATASHVPDTIQSPVQTVSPRIASLVALKATLPKAPADSVPRPNSVALSIAVPVFDAISISRSVVLPAA